MSTIQQGNHLQTTNQHDYRRITPCQMMVVWLGKHCPTIHDMGVTEQAPNACCSRGCCCSKIMVVVWVDPPTRRIQLAALVVKRRWTSLCPRIALTKSPNPKTIVVTTRMMMMMIFQKCSPKRPSMIRAQSWTWSSPIRTRTIRHHPMRSSGPIL
jgi:hypothetical protein